MWLSHFLSPLAHTYAHLRSDMCVHIYITHTTCTYTHHTCVFHHTGIHAPYTHSTHMYVHTQHAHHTYSLPHARTHQEHTRDQSKENISNSHRVPASWSYSALTVPCTDHRQAAGRRVGGERGVRSNHSKVMPFERLQFKSKAITVTTLSAPPPIPGKMPPYLN